MRMINQSTSSRKRKASSDAESLDMYDIEEEGFIEGDITTGKSIAAFNFSMSTGTQKDEAAILSQPDSMKSNYNAASNDQFYKSIPRGITPPISGEHFSIKRGYQLRPSTLRKLNELKVKHPDANVYLNTILDAAILHYYNYIINEKGEF